MSVYGKSKALLRLSVFLLYKRLQKKSRKRRYWVHPILQKRMSNSIIYLFVLNLLS